MPSDWRLRSHPEFPRTVATVFQDLATVPLMSVWRNFFLGNEPTRGWGALQRLDIRQAQKIMREEMSKMGIDVRDPNQAVGTLSGGERQAVAIARAVYFGAKVLILDEPTSALDVTTEALVMAAIETLIEGRTVFIIAHRLSSVRQANRIITLDRGRIVEDGTHDELARSGGRYANLLRLQAGIQEIA